MRELFAGRHGRVAAGLMVSEFVAATQGLVIAAIMPRVVADLHGLGEYGLAFGSFFVAFLIFVPFAGPWADRYGLRPMLAIALALLALGLALVALAPNMAWFIVARFVEGIGDGLDYAFSFAAIAKTFPERLRARMLSLNATMWVLPGLIAPGLGAYVATEFGWRWAFAALVPLIALAAALLLPALEAKRVQQSDPYGAIRLLFSAATLTAQRGLHASLAAFTVLHAAFLGADAYVALMLTGVRGISLEAASICITLAVLGWSPASLLAPTLSRRTGPAGVVAIGSVPLLLANVALACVAVGAPVWIAFVAWFAGGAGIGVSYPTLPAAMMNDGEEGREGAVSSATALGAIVGVLIGIFLCGIPVSLSARGALALGPALACTFAIAACFAAVLALIARRVGPA